MSDKQHIVTISDASATLPSTAPSPGDRATLVSELFRKHNRALISFLLVHLSNEQEAREVAQEAYVKLLQLDKPEAIGFLRAYLFRTAINIATDLGRRRGRRERIERLEIFDEWSERASVEEGVLAEQEVDIVRHAIDELKPKCRRAFVLHRFQDRSIAEVAQEMDLTPRMVRSYVARAVLYCRLRLDGYSATDAARAAQELQG
jgi:RNA polymerase sigma factor (sigma-70 family)